MIAQLLTWEKGLILFAAKFKALADKSSECRQDTKACVLKTVE